MKAVFLSVVALIFMHGSAVAQWSTSPAINNPISGQPGEQVVSYVATHPSGVNYISYFATESGYYLPYIQKVDVFGYTQWAGYGIRVSNQPSMTWITDYDMNVSPDTGVVIAFQDIRTGNNEIYAYKLSPAGEFLWGANGVTLSNNGDFNASPVLTVNSDNSVVVAWPRASNTGGDDVVMMQKIQPNGQVAWSQPVTFGEAGFDFNWPRVLSVEETKTLLICYKEWGPYWAPNRIILAQKFDENGNPAWGTPKTLFNGAMPVYVLPVVASDGDGGAFVTWFYELAANHLSTFVNHVDHNGNVTMGANGTEASTNTATLHMEPALSCDTATEDVYVFWRETNLAQSQYGLAGQRLTCNGNRKWGANGKTLVNLSGQQTAIINTSNVSTGAIVSYLYGSVTSSEVKAIRVDTNGLAVWSGGVRTVSNSAGGKDDLVNGGFHNGQLVYSWTDSRNGQNDIYAQNLIEDGTMGPVTQSIEVSPDTLYFLTPDELMTGKPFFIHNPNAIMTDVQSLDQTGILDPGLMPWYVDPHINQFPVSILPGDTFSRTVKWDMPVEGLLLPILYDTLNIRTITDSARIIIAVDSMLIITSLKAGDPLDLQVYPNPAKDFLRISGNFTDATISLITLTGSLSKEMTHLSSPAFLELSGLRQGIYLLRVTEGQFTVVRKIAVIN
ncbi:MAG: T9SS type A sorting domain-containing protein [bacterium]